MTGTIHMIIVIAVAALATLATRALPFIVFGNSREVPAPVLYLGRVLPPSIMAVLVIYCLRNIHLAFTCGAETLLSASAAARYATCY